MFTHEFPHGEGELVAMNSSSCQAFLTGHKVHWVQARRSWDKELGLYVPCVVTNCADDGWLTVQIEGEPDDQFFWTHDPEAGRNHIGRTNLFINRNWGLIKSDWITSSTYLSVGVRARSCVLESPDGLPHEQLESHGGFTISGPEALKLYGKADSASEADTET